MSNTQKVSDDRLDAVALAITRQIESVFYHDQPGGAVQTRAKVQVIIADALRAAPTPDPHSEVGVKLSPKERELLDRCVRLNNRAEEAEGRLAALTIGVVKA